MIGLYLDLTEILENLESEGAKKKSTFRENLNMIFTDHDPYDFWHKRKIYNFDPNSIPVVLTWFSCPGSHILYIINI